MNELPSDDVIAQMVSELPAEDKLLLLRVLIELDKTRQ